MKPFLKEEIFMSAFLGKIHYWLFNKILLHENIIDEITRVSSDKGVNTNSIIESSYKKYGLPVRGNLENEIEHSNIHGWLQEKIASVEKRLAFIITELLNEGTISKEEIANVFKQNAESTMKVINASEGNPQDYFTLVFDYMLEGMPCDRVNEIVENNSEKITWKTTRCLHRDYWNEVGGDVVNYYYLRNSWINGFLSAGNTEYRYTRTEDNINIIERV
jgi:hypothetical protein